MSFSPEHIATQLRAYRPGAFPGRSSLTIFARSLRGKKHVATVERDKARLFITAGIEMWQRAIHSFLISVSTTRSSEIWSAVSGYYASHYVARAYSHLYGYWGLAERGELIELRAHGNDFRTSVTTGFKEHSGYSDTVHALFNNALFKYSNDKDHRGYANYRDHLNRFTEFRIEDDAFVRDHVAALARQDVFIPAEKDDLDEMWKYPQVGLVQQLAIHRIAHFRSHLDSLTAGKSKFWQACRSPDWERGMMKYDLAGRVNPIDN